MIWLIGCLPTFEDRAGRVDEPRILAVRGLPAEARPNAPITLEALAVSPEEPMPSSVQWSYCEEPRTVDERTAVTAACAQGDALVSVTAATVIPGDACARFGPNPPPVEGDEPPRRPADPDPTGGYFLPYQAATEAARAFGFQRIRCDLSGATRVIFDAFEDRYVENEHPTIEALLVPERLGVGETVTLGVRTAPEDAEPYVVYVAEESALFDRIETLTASFYTTAGGLSQSRVELADGRATTQFTAPSEPGVVEGWVVVVDARGGVVWDGFTMEIR
ncbi:MAG: hypothetical protein AAGA48_33475 [Myxococcota bacterium]